MRYSYLNQKWGLGIGDWGLGPNLYIFFIILKFNEYIFIYLDISSKPYY